MGTFGPGLFDNDKALDYLDTFSSKLIHEIDVAVAHPSQLMPDEYWGNVMPCQIELLLCLHKDVHAKLPTLKQSETWRDKYMEVWRANIDSLQPKPLYKSKRREVLEDLFARLIRAAS